MDQPDFKQAKQYALHRLERDLVPTLRYHSVAHTRDDVVPAVERLAVLQGLSEDDTLLVSTAAYYHDIGFVEQAQDHETLSIQIASAILPLYHYTPTQIAAINGMILATRTPQSPHNLLEELLADADLDVLGRMDFLHQNTILRAELAALGQQVTDIQWYSEQLAFMRHHHYWTRVAQRLRHTQKQRNIALLTDLLDRCYRYS